MQGSKRFGTWVAGHDAAPAYEAAAEALLYGLVQLQNKIKRTNTIAR